MQSEVRITVEKRLMLAIVLSLGVFLIFSSLMETDPAMEQTGQQETTSPAQQTADTSTENTPSKESAQIEEGAPEPAESAPTPEQRAVVQISSETVPFRTDGLIGYFNLNGARLQSIQARNFSRLDDRSDTYDLVAENGRGLYVELGYPEPIIRNQKFHQLQTEDPNHYSFETTLENGLRIRKDYRFNPKKDYYASLEVMITNPSSEARRLDNIEFPVGSQGQGGLAVVWGPGFGKERATRGFLDKPYIYYWKNGGMESLAPQGGGRLSMLGLGGGEDEDGITFIRGPVDWTAPSSRYFQVATVPEQPFDMLVMEKNLYSNSERSFTSWSGYSPVELLDNETRRFSFDLYLGPKDYYSLQEFQAGMEESMNFWFSMFYLPQAMLWILHTVYAVIPNYGISIILLSFIIKFMLYPLTKKGLVSMRKMRELQPEMKRIQEEYSDDKEKQQQKMIEFYQEHDLNPLGGCLPLLLQIPFFIALYSILRYSIDLRGAYFFLWIDDLSAMDPYYVLPVLMGAMMFFQQRYTLSSGGGSTGQQQKMMMYIMPPAMTIFFLYFPVGLVLYFMTNSAVTMLQYWLIDQSMEGEEA